MRRHETCFHQLHVLLFQRSKAAVAPAEGPATQEDISSGLMPARRAAAAQAGSPARPAGAPLASSTADPVGLPSILHVNRASSAVPSRPISPAAAF